MYYEELLENQEKGKIDTRDLILNHCILRQQQDLITDVFLLVAVVMRERCGAITQHADVLWDTLVRKKNVQIFSFSCFGLACNIAIASVLWYNGLGSDVGHGIYQYRDMYTSEAAAAASQARYYLLVLLQIALTSSTIVCCILIYQRGVMFSVEKRHLWSGIDMLQFTKAMLAPQSEKEHKEEIREQLLSSYSLAKSSHRFRMTVEIALHLIHPFIWLNEPDTQVFFRILEMAIFVRLYLVGNLVFLLSEAYQSRVEILDKNVELQGTGSGITLGLTLKMQYFSHPVTFTMLLMMGTLAVLGFVMFIAERGVQPTNVAFGSLENTYWFSFVTFATIGYGDMVPVSAFGRFVAVIIASSGILITTILSGVIINLVAASREQRFVQEYLERADSAHACRESAAEVIQSAFRFFRLRSGHLLMPWIRRTGHKANFLYGAIEKFRDVRWRFTKSVSTSGDPVVDTKMNFVKSDVVQCATLLDRHEKSVTATIDNLHQRVHDILHILDGK